jgi:hypothetical protein
MGRSSFGKLERDRAKKAKAQAKRERRQAAVEAGDGEEATVAPADGLSTADVLEQLEELHRRYDAGEVGDDDFQETKAELLGRLSVD